MSVSKLTWGETRPTEGFVYSLVGVSGAKKPTKGIGRKLDSPEKTLYRFVNPCRISACKSCMSASLNLLLLKLWKALLASPSHFPLLSSNPLSASLSPLPVTQRLRVGSGIVNVSDVRLDTSDSFQPPAVRVSDLKSLYSWHLISSIHGSELILSFDIRLPLSLSPFLHPIVTSQRVQSVDPFPTLFEPHSERSRLDVLESYFAHLEPWIPRLSEGSTLGKLFGRLKQSYLSHSSISKGRRDPQKSTWTVKHLGLEIWSIASGIRYRYHIIVSHGCYWPRGLKYTICQRAVSKSTTFIVTDFLLWFDHTNFIHSKFHTITTQVHTNPGNVRKNQPVRLDRRWIFHQFPLPREEIQPNLYTRMSADQESRALPASSICPLRENYACQPSCYLLCKFCLHVTSLTAVYFSVTPSPTSNLTNRVSLPMCSWKN